MNLRKHYQVNEVFTSIQGEGVLVGTPSTFIRLQGCTVGCSWCDSGPLADLPTEQEYLDAMADASDNNEPMVLEELRKELKAFQLRQTNGLTRNTWGAGGNRMSVEDILEKVDRHHVIITGGEPTMYDLDGLLVPLQRAGHNVQLETSGQNGLKGMVKPNWITWSPKENLKWDAEYDIKTRAKEVKWVVDEPLEWDWVWKTFIGYITRAEKGKTPYNYTEIPFMVLMPEGSPPRQEMVDRCVRWLDRIPSWAGVFFRFGDRLQYRIGAR